MTLASTGGHSDWGYYNNEEHHGAHNNSDVEYDTDARFVPLRVSSGIQGLGRKDDGGDGEKEADDKRTTCDQGAKGEDDSTCCHSHVILLQRRYEGGGRRCRRLCRYGYRCWRPCRYHDGAGGGLRAEVVRELVRFTVVARRRYRLMRCVGWRKVGLSLRWIALGRMVLDRRQRVLHRGDWVLG